MAENPYTAPRADLQTAATSPTSASGSLEAGINGRYELGIGLVMSEAWELTKGAKLPMVLAYLVSMAIAYGLMFALTALGMGGQQLGADGNPVAFAVVGFVGALVVYPVMLSLNAGLMMMGVRRATGRKIGVGDVFHWFHRVPALVGILVLMMILVTLGFFLLVIPGIYLAVAYALAIQVMLDKKLSPWRALEASRKAISRNWFSVLGLTLVVTLVVMLSAIPLGIGLIWTFPWAMICFGVLYRRIFGVEASTLGGAAA